MVCGDYFFNTNDVTSVQNTSDVWVVLFNTVAVVQTELNRYIVHQSVTPEQAGTKSKVYLPELTGTKTPVCRNIALDSDLAIPRSAFLVLPFAVCSESPGGTRHRLAPLRQPIPRDERWAGQIVHVEISCGGANIDARAKTSSTSEWTSVIPTLRVCPDASLLQDDNGTTSSRSYRLSEAQMPPTSFLNEQVTSITATED